MMLGFRYRGSHFSREVGDEGWAVDGVCIPMTWNGALSLVDGRNIGPAPFSLTCCECGDRDFATYMEPCRTRMIAKSMCFTCDFYDERHKTLGHHTFAAGGCVYTLGCAGDYPKGFGGARFRATWPDGHVVEGDSLWSNGHVPAHWLERFADTVSLEWLS